MEYGVGSALESVYPTANQKYGSTLLALFDGRVLLKNEGHWVPVDRSSLTSKAPFKALDEGTCRPTWQSGAMPALCSAQLRIPCTLSYDFTPLSGRSV